MGLLAGETGGLMAMHIVETCDWNQILARTQSIPNSAADIFWEIRVANFLVCFSKYLIDTNKNFFFV